MSVFATEIFVYLIKKDINVKGLCSRSNYVQCVLDNFQYGAHYICDCRLYFE